MIELDNIVDQLRTHKENLWTAIQDLRAEYARVHEALVALVALGGGWVALPADDLPTVDNHQFAISDPVVPSVEQVAEVARTEGKAAAKALLDKPKAAPRGVHTKMDWQAVLDWVTAAKADGSYSLAAVTAKFGTNAKNWKARTANLLPTGAPAPMGRPIGGKVLACDDCGFEVSLDRVAALRSHVLDTHGRRPSDGERTPVAPKVAA